MRAFLAEATTQNSNHTADGYICTVSTKSVNDILEFSGNKSTISTVGTPVKGTLDDKCLVGGGDLQKGKRQKLTFSNCLSHSFPRTLKTSDGPKDIGNISLPECNSGVRQKRSEQKKTYLQLRLYCNILELL